MMQTAIFHDGPYALCRSAQVSETWNRSVMPILSRHAAAAGMMQNEFQSDTHSSNGKCHSTA